MDFIDGITSVGNSLVDTFTNTKKQASSAPISIATTVATATPNTYLTTNNDNRVNFTNNTTNNVSNTTNNNLTNNITNTDYKVINDYFTTNTTSNNYTSNYTSNNFTTNNTSTNNTSITNITNNTVNESKLNDITQNLISVNTSQAKITSSIEDSQKMLDNGFKSVITQNNDTQKSLIQAVLNQQSFNSYVSTEFNKQTQNLSTLNTQLIQNNETIKKELTNIENIVNLNTATRVVQSSPAPIFLNQSNSSNSEFPIYMLLPFLIIFLK